MSEMRKKRILFLSNPMRCGGIEKAMLSILSVMDYDKYEVFFMPYSPEPGEWDYMVPEQVHRLERPEYLRWAMMYREDVGAFVRAHLTHPTELVAYFRSVLDGKREKFMDSGRQKFWVRNQKRYPSYDGEFDIAVDFRGEIGCYFMLDKISAKHKISWYHGDYKVYIQRDHKIDRLYWSKLERLISITETAESSIREVFPELSEKVEVIHNLVLKEQLHQAASAGIEVKKNKPFFILSVGRLESDKGYELSIEACRILKERGQCFEWHVLGDGTLKADLNVLVENYGLHDVFILDGSKNNPYPYYKAADIFVLTAYWEGKPIVLDEARLFGLPVVATAYSTVGDQITDGVNGTVTDFEPEHIADALEQLMRDEDLRTRYSQWMETHPIDVEEDIAKLEQLWNL